LGEQFTIATAKPLAATRTRVVGITEKGGDGRQEWLRNAGRNILLDNLVFLEYNNDRGQCRMSGSARYDN